MRGTQPQSHAIVTHFPTKGLKHEPAGYEQRDSTKTPIKFFIRTIRTRSTRVKVAISGSESNKVLYWNYTEREESVFLAGFALRPRYSDHKVSAGKGH